MSTFTVAPSVTRTVGPGEERLSGPNPQPEFVSPYRTMYPAGAWTDTVRTGVRFTFPSTPRAHTKTDMDRARSWAGTTYQYDEPWESIDTFRFTPSVSVKFNRASAIATECVTVAVRFSGAPRSTDMGGANSLVGTFAGVTSNAPPAEFHRLLVSDAQMVNWWIPTVEYALSRKYVSPRPLAIDAFVVPPGACTSSHTPPTPTLSATVAETFTGLPATCVAGVAVTPAIVGGSVSKTLPVVKVHVYGEPTALPGSESSRAETFMSPPYCVLAARFAVGLNVITVSRGAFQANVPGTQPPPGTSCRPKDPGAPVTTASIASLHVTWTFVPSGTPAESGTGNAPATTGGVESTTGTEASAHPRSPAESTTVRFTTTSPASSEGTVQSNEIGFGVPGSGPAMAPGPPADV